MICDNCKRKPIGKGIKIVKCLKCNSKAMINYLHKDICISCSDKLGICQYCGQLIFTTS